MPLPPELEADKVTGEERTSVVRSMSDGTNKRFLLPIGNILAFARRVSPTVKSIALSAKNTLTYVTTDGKVVDIGGVPAPSILLGAGPPNDSTGKPGDVFIDPDTGDLFNKGA